jgi:hypothetical protein
VARGTTKFAGQTKFFDVMLFDNMRLDKIEGQQPPLDAEKFGTADRSHAGASLGLAGSGTITFGSPPNRAQILCALANPRYHKGSC